MWFDRLDYNRLIGSACGGQVLVTCLPVHLPDTWGLNRFRRSQPCQDKIFCLAFNLFCNVQFCPVKVRMSMVMNMKWCINFETMETCIFRHRSAKFIRQYVTRDILCENRRLEICRQGLAPINWVSWCRQSVSQSVVCDKWQTASCCEPHGYWRSPWAWRLAQDTGNVQSVT